MTGSRKKLPIGVDIFEKIIREDYYYLDKTAFIRELIDWRGEVNLFTRPMRFGKTLFSKLAQTKLCSADWPSAGMQNYAKRIWENTRLCFCR